MRAAQGLTLAELRGLSSTFGRALKRCCAALDAMAGTSFAAEDAQIEADGAALMRSLLASGAAGAADATRQHVWGRRASELLPRIAYVVQRAGAWNVCAPAQPSRRGGGTGAGGEGSGGGREWRVLCPLAAVERDACCAGCTRPGCTSTRCRHTSRGATAVQGLCARGLLQVREVVA